MRPYQYMLNDQGEPIVAPDLITWAVWFECANRVVDRTYMGNAEVSTVFLGLDHNFSGEGEPILWETMIFDGELNECQERCAGTKADAQAMHDRVVRRVTDLLAGILPDENDEQDT